MARRPASVLLAVLVVVAMSTLIGTASLVLAGAQRDAAMAPLRRDQARALAWSGVQGVMSELSAQRLSLLDGETPTLTHEWTVFEEGGVRGLYRLIDIDGGGELPIESEAGKLDINRATIEMLEKLELVGRALAQAIVSRREQSEFGSVDELLSVSGVTPRLLYGDEADEGEFLSEDGEPTRLLDVLTVHAADPNVQFGYGERGADYRGKLRICLNREWSDEMGDAITDRFDLGTANGVKSVMTEASALSPDGKPLAFDSDADIVAVLRRLAGLSSPDFSSWYELLDVFTGKQDEYVRGRVDINTAPAAVLACLPGIDREAADEIVAARATIDASRRRSVVWLGDEGILTGEQMEEAIDHITSRSMQWRVQIEAGLQAIESGLGQGEVGSGGGRIGGLDSLEESPLESRIVLEVVIDVASARPRVAYMRDITLMGFAASRLAGVETGEAEVPGPVEELLESGNAGASDAVDPGHEFDLGAGGDEADPDPGATSSVPAVSGSPFSGNEGDEPGVGSEAESIGSGEPRTDAGSSSAPAPPSDSRVGRWKSQGVRP